MYYLIVILSVLGSSVAQMLLKKGATESVSSSFFKEYLNRWVISGYIILGVSILVNVFAMSHGVQVKEVCSIESLSYLFIPILSYFCFKESLSVRKIISIIFIITGVIVFFS